jgi:hypothetical protein
MLTSGTRIPLTPQEDAAIDELLAEHGDGSFSRRDPGETGPVLLRIGKRTWEIADDGKAREVSGG